jgi:hypothetical protein
MLLRMHLKCGLHDLDVWGSGDRWSLAIDGLVLRQRFRSMSDARETGLVELKRTRTASASPDPDSPGPPALV